MPRFITTPPQDDRITEGAAVVLVEVGDRLQSLALDLGAAVARARAAARGREAARLDWKWGPDAAAAATARAGALARAAAGANAEAARAAAPTVGAVAADAAIVHGLLVSPGGAPPKKVEVVALGPRDEALGKATPDARGYFKIELHLFAGPKGEVVAEAAPGAAAHETAAAAKKRRAAPSRAAEIKVTLAVSTGGKITARSPDPITLSPGIAVWREL